MHILACFSMGTSKIEVLGLAEVLLLWNAKRWLKSIQINCKHRLRTEDSDLMKWNELRVGPR
jgi:hypothetical protein